MNCKYTTLALFVTLIIIYISSIPDWALWGNGSLNEQIVSNTAHIPAYALLAFLWIKSFDRTRFRKSYFTINSLILVCLVHFAFTDEIHQSFVPGRSASFMDIGLDLIDILLGLGTFRVLRMFSISQF